MGKKKSGEKKLGGFTTCFFCNQPEKFIGWTDKERESITDVKKLAAVIAYKLEGMGAEIESLFTMLHNKDQWEIWSEIIGAYHEEPKPDHIHILVKFHKNKGLTRLKIAMALGVDHDDIKKFRRGSNSYIDASAYLIHAKEPHKYRYDPQEVYTFCGRENYMEIYRRKYAAWQKQAASKKAYFATEDDEVEYLHEEVLRGRITMDDILDDPWLQSVYTRKVQQIDEAFKMSKAVRIRQNTKALKQKLFKKTFLFIEGESGTGKTTFANALIRYLEHAYSWTSITLASRNAMDDYDGADIILLNDLRAGAMPAEDWLGLIDAANPSRMSARYKNTDEIAPRVIILTANQTPIEFFSEVKGANQEAASSSRVSKIDAYLRRCDLQLKVLKPNDDIGYNNVLMFNPSYQQKAFTIGGHFLKDGRPDPRFEDIHYSMQPYPGHAGVNRDDVYSIYAAMEEIARLIDDRNKNLFARIDKDPEEHFEESREYIYTEFMPDDEPLDNMPALPDPWSGFLHDTLPRSEVEARSSEEEYVDEGMQEFLEQTHMEYDTWLKKFDAYKEAGTLPQGWCKGAPRRLLEGEPPTRPEPADPDAPREEGSPDAPLSYDGFMRYVYDSFHVSIVDELDTARLALSIVNREMENAQFEDVADE